MKSNYYFNKFINDDVKGLKSLLNSNIIIKNPILRITENSGIMFVFKIQNSKYISELVLRQHLDKFMIYEIN